MIDQQPIRLFCDNQVAINIAKNPVHHDRTKHVGLIIISSWRRSKMELSKLSTSLPNIKLQTFLLKRFQELDLKN